MKPKLIPTGGTTEAQTVALCCPYCHRDGSFHPLPNRNDACTKEGQTLGNRQCPNRECRAHVFVVLAGVGRHEVVWSYPAERVTFDTTDIPRAVVGTFEE